MIFCTLLMYQNHHLIANNFNQTGQRCTMYIMLSYKYFTVVYYRLLAVIKCILTIVSYISPACYGSHLSVYQSLTICWQANRLNVFYTQTCACVN